MVGLPGLEGELGEGDVRGDGVQVEVGGGDKELGQQRHVLRPHGDAGLLQKLPAGGGEGVFPRFGAAPGDLPAAGVFGLAVRPAGEQDLPPAVQRGDLHRQVVRPLWERGAPLYRAAQGLAVLVVQVPQLGRGPLHGRELPPALAVPLNPAVEFLPVRRPPGGAQGALRAGDLFPLAQRHPPGGVGLPGLEADVRRLSLPGEGVDVKVGAGAAVFLEEQGQLLPPGEQARLLPQLPANGLQGGLPRQDRAAGVLPPAGAEVLFCGPPGEEHLSLFVHDDHDHRQVVLPWGQGRAPDMGAAQGFAVFVVQVPKFHSLSFPRRGWGGFRALSPASRRPASGRGRRPGPPGRRGPGSLPAAMFYLLNHKRKKTASL